MMQRLFLVFCLISIAGSAQLASAQQNIANGASAVATQTIVDQFYPQQLVDPAYPNDRNSCFGVMQVGQDGQPSIIIANYLDARGAIRILTRGANGAFTAIDGPSGLNLGGSNCSIEFIDVDGDGAKEIHLAIIGAGVGTADWLFRWNGSSLTTLNPVTQGKFASSSEFGNANFADLYHDGALAVYCVQTYPPSQDGKSDEPDRVYRWQNGTYQRSANALLLALPAGGPSSPFTATFGVAKGSGGPYTLRVINGDSQGNHRASGQVLINGQVVTSFQLTGDSITSSAITVTSANQLTVNFDAQYTDGNLAIVVEDGSPVPSPPSSLTAVANGNNQITLSFVPSVSAGVYAYHFYRGLESGVAPSPGNLVRVDQISSNSFRDHGLMPSTTYFYVVEAVNGYGSSAPSNEASATTSSQTPVNSMPPSAPSGLSVQALGTQNNLSWSASTTAGVTYSIFRSTVSGFAPSGSNRIANKLTATRYVDTGLNPSTVYYYLAEAVNSAGSSSPSNQVMAAFG